MKTSGSTFECSGCGAVSLRWAGRCSECGEWNTLAEQPVRMRPVAGTAVGATTATALAAPVTDVDVARWAPVATGEPELDRVLNGGLVPGSVTLLGGEPGIGKSTLALQLMGQLAAAGARCLYLSAEESADQVRVRAGRVGAADANLFVASASELPDVLAQVDDVNPTFLVVDSVQAIVDPDVPAGPGSVSQVRACAYVLVQLAKHRAMATVIVGHVTKDGSLAGPRALEHVVDTVLSFEGDRRHSHRLVRALKHRFGATGEVGVFQMAETGLQAVPDPGAFFLADRCFGMPGSVVVPTVDGHRALLVEVQALVAPAAHESPPRRSVQGLDAGRLGLLLAVLQRRAKLALSRCDVYALAVGGAKATDPGADLGLALAVASSWKEVVIPPTVVACAEVGLSGELRQPSHLERRLAEAARLGFKRAVVPVSTPDVAVDSGLRLVRAATLMHALDAVAITPGRPRTAAKKGTKPAARGSTMKLCPTGDTSG